MLASDAHGGFGGIAQYNRDLIDALVSQPQVAEIVVLVRGIEDPDFAAPAKVTYDRAAAGGAFAFIQRALHQAALGGRFDLVLCGHVNLTPLAFLARWIAGARLVVSVHGTDVWTPPPRRVTGWSLRAADLILSVSAFTAERMRSWLKHPIPPVAVIPNAIAAERFGPGDKDPELVQRHGLAGKRVIMTLGRMAANERAKGFDELIELMPSLHQLCPDLVYLCAGDGDDRARLEAKARDLGCGHIVRFTGRVPEARKADYFRLADAYVHPSQMEGFGIVLLEALACGIPVVGSTLDATEEALLHGELGCAVDPYDKEALTDTILDAINQPKRVPERLSYYAHENFSARVGKALRLVMTT
jgi:glycosyltransferase involved in cell wall biosynthesis